MTHHEHPKIIVFVGLAGAGKTTATSYFAKHGYPKVALAPLQEPSQNLELINTAASQIEHLLNSGQRTITVDGLTSWKEFNSLRSAFPGNVIAVAIVAPRELRYHRLNNREVNPLTNAQAHELDTHEIEHLEKAGPIAVADHYIVNDGSLEDLETKLNELKVTLEL